MDTLRKTDLSIIIVSWNVRDFLVNCLKSVYETVKDISFEIIMVDNNSSDNAPKIIKEKFPLVRIIQNKINFGFAAANNQAIKISNGKYILLLNPDTLTSASAIEGILKFMDKNNSAGIATCFQYRPDGKMLPINMAIRNYNFFYYNWLDDIKNNILNDLSLLFPKNKLVKRTVFAEIAKQPDLGIICEKSPVEINVASGAFFMIKRTVIEKIGFFDERFFFNYDDFDFCYRARAAGWKIYLHPEYKIIHFSGESTKQWDKDKIKRIKIYTYLLFYKKYKGIFKLTFLTFKILFCIALKAILYNIFIPLLIVKGYKINRDTTIFSSMRDFYFYINNFFIVAFNLKMPKYE